MCAGIGAGAAVLKFRQYPWKGGTGAPPTPSGGQAIVDQDEFDFGRMDVIEDGKHEFTITNQGDKNPLAKSWAHLLPLHFERDQGYRVGSGQSTKVTVTWPRNIKSATFSRA